MSSSSSSASDLTLSEGSCASGDSGVDSKQLQYQQPKESSPPAQPPTAPAPADSTATSSMGAYGSTYTTDANEQLCRIYPGN
ncbi:unnamed protein product [Rotaria sordida]|uniref:Uncharacterized protein n=1 Tax=Rotaria sordida TaxID=392033 RepID=A0A819C235_9BILA|nr:unnamed protein product [Rotaria sordida]CAF1302624.1 unnamed protein product [Rotaria sordida]CAF1448471.1 unnamed protein product [Rotaria sordida]CAF3811948.1 unnamed protein product [Rotaria sordida]